MTMLLKKNFILSLFLSLLFCSAFAQTTYKGESLAQVVIYQNKSKNAVTVTLIESSTPKGLLSIRADILNHSPKKVHLYYRVLWLNPQGQQLNADSWRPLLLLPNKSLSINATAPLTNVTDFSLEVKAD